VSFRYKVYTRVIALKGGTKPLYVAAFRSLADAVEYVHIRRHGYPYYSVKTPRGVIFSSREATESLSADYALADKRDRKPLLAPLEPVAEVLP
jgi:hypothetical protein